MDRRIQLTIFRSLRRAGLRRCAAGWNATLVPTAMVFAISMFLGLKVEGQTYSVTDLGTLGGNGGGLQSVADGINNSGQVVGGATAPGGFDAFSYTSSGGMTDLGTLGGSSSVAAAINTSGQIVGAASTSGNTGSHAFSYTSSGGMTDLGTFGGSYSAAAAINTSGQIVGWANTSASPPNTGGATSPRAFSYTSGGGMTDLGTLGGSYSSAAAINTSGQIVGSANTSGNTGSHAFSYTSSGGMTDLGTLGGSYSSASGINDNDQIVGSSYTSSGNQYAFSYTSGGGMVDLGALAGDVESYANGINNSGQIVGVSLGATISAFIDNSGTMVNLNSLIAPGSGWDLQAATAINDNGDIVGYGQNAAGQYDAFLLTPNDLSSVPERPTVALYFLAAAALALASRKCGLRYET